MHEWGVVFLYLDVSVHYVRQITLMGSVLAVTLVPYDADECKEYVGLCNGVLFDDIEGILAYDVLVKINMGTPYLEVTPSLIRVL